MAPPKKPLSKLGRTAKYYRKNKKAREKKAQTDKKINSRPDQLKKRVELIQKNRQYDRKFGKSKRKGKDYDHAKGRYVKSSVNRGRRGEGGRK